MQETYLEHANSDFEQYKIGWSIGLIDSPGGAVKYYRIENREQVTWLENQSDSWVSSLSTSTQTSAGDISNWLEPDDNTLYVLKVGIHSHPNMINMSISIPASTTKGGVKNTTTPKFNGKMSPLYNPTFVAYCWGTSLIPNFTFFNDSNQNFDANTGFIKVSAMGHRYALAPVEGTPEVSSIINLTAMGGA
jgi:hypothetical protein